MKIQKIILTLTILVACFLNSYGQNDWWGMNISDHSYQISYSERCEWNMKEQRYCYQTQHLELIGVFVNLKTQETVLQFKAYKQGCKDVLHPPVSMGDYIKWSDEIKIKSIGKVQVRDYIWNKYGWSVKDNEKTVVTMEFDGILPLNAVTFSFYFNNITTNIKWDGLSDEIIKKYYGFSLRSNWTETLIKEFADANNDGICGVYHGILNKNDKYGCIKEDGVYKIIWLGTNIERRTFEIGNVIGVLYPSGAENTYKAKYIDENYRLREYYVEIKDNWMNYPFSSKKVYPNTQNNNSGRNNNSGGYNSSNSGGFTAKWSGSGFALNRGYIATNHHVIDGARNIKVYGIKGNFNVGYNAQVVLSDPHNDLAVIKINDSRFTSFGTIPYRVKTNMAEVGEEVFVLGYPMTTTMGDEIKLTTGVISARSGFQGDLSLYQTTAPIQPGNSGGPLFDNSGNLIGIVNAKHTGAENVGYAIKASYLSNLIQSGSMSGLLPQTNSISGQNLSGKVKSVKNFVFLIKCN